MDTVLSVMQTLVQALRDAVKGVKANKEQSNELLKRSERLVQEFARLNRKVINHLSLCPFFLFFSFLLFLFLYYPPFFFFPFLSLK